MKKNIFFNIFFLVFINLLIKPIWILGVDRVVQNKVGAENFGIYFTVFNFSMLLSILLDMGLTNYNNRTIAQRNILLEKFLPGIVVVKLGLGLFYLFITIITGLILGFSSLHFKFLFFLAANQIFISFIFYFRSNIAALQHFMLDSFVSVIDRILMIIFCFILFIYLSDSFTIEAFIYVQTAAYGLTALIAFIVNLNWINKLSFTINFSIIKKIIVQSLPFALLVLLMTLYTRLDSVMIERLLGKEGGTQSGYYAAAYRVLDSGSMIGFLFAGILLPAFSKMIKKKESVNALVAWSFKTLGGLSLIVSIAGLFFSKELMFLLYPDYSNDLSVIFEILMIALIPFNLVYVFGSLLTANGNLKSLIKISASCLLINLVLNFILILKYNAAGAAATALVTQSASALAHIFLAVKIFKFRISKEWIIRFMLFVTVVILIHMFLKDITNAWEINILITSALSVVSAFVLKIMDISSILSVFKIIKH